MYYVYLPELTFSTVPRSNLGVDYIEVDVAPPMLDPWEYNREYRWSLSLEMWVLPFTDERLSDYRDLMIQVEVVYENDNSEEFRFMNNDRTRAALVGKMNYLPIKNDPLLTINFETLDGFKAMTGSDLQGAFQALSESEQIRFDAKEYILGIHAVTPYEDINDAFEDFDTYVTNNS